MTKTNILVFIFLICSACVYAQQNPLPSFNVKNISGKIIVSWVNDYANPVTVINIQRSYDSLRNFSTIGSVLSAQSRENGFTDANPPYNKMYYRIFISFDGGNYIFTSSEQPVKDTQSVVEPPQRYSWMAIPSPVAVSVPGDTTTAPPAAPGITYPSERIFTARDNNVIIHLPDAATKKYIVKFFDENDKFLFEVSKLKEDLLIIEKVNFVHTGWFRFELYDDGLLIENNKFQIQKDPKKL